MRGMLLPWLSIAGVLIGVSNDSYFTALVCSIAFYPVWLVYIFITQNYVMQKIQSNIYIAVGVKGWGITKSTVVFLLIEFVAVVTTVIPIALLAHFLTKIFI